jgi:response regulator RpfG family c-di-GMP phosphodiesterase
MKKILITSSAASFVERNGALLRRSDFQIFNVSNASAGFDIIDSEAIDLVLVDILLDDMPGEAFCQKLYSRPSSAKFVLILVCNDNEHDMERLKSCGADALLARPVKPLQLIKTVGQFLTVQLVRSRRVALRVKVTSKKDQVEFFCISHNISLTGMLIETEYFLEIGSAIICQFLIPGSMQVETEGEVVRSDRTMDGAHQYGVYFTTLSRTYRHEIDAYIASVARGEKQPEL